MAPPPIFDEVREAVRELDLAEKELRRARKKLHRTVRKAQKSPQITMGDVAAIWGVSRQGLYKMLREMS